MKKKLIFCLRELFGIILLLQKNFISSKHTQILSIYFHNPSPYLFERIIKHLINRRYKIIPLKQFCEILDNRKLNEKVAIITMDDGWQNNLKLLEIIRKYKVYTTIFITTKSVEEGNFWWEYAYRRNIDHTQNKNELNKIKQLNEKEFKEKVEELKSSLILERSALTKEQVIRISEEEFVEIGSHTVSHPILTNISSREQTREMLDSKVILESWINKKISYFSYPNGNYSDQLTLLAKECGYELCFTTDAAFIDLNNVSKLSIPRRCINDNGGYFEALAKIYALWQLYI